MLRALTFFDNDDPDKLTMNITEYRILTDNALVLVLNTEVLVLVLARCGLLTTTQFLQRLQ